MGRGRRPGLSFVRSREALREEDRHSDPGLEVREAMTSPALAEVHLLRGPGDPAGHHQDRSRRPAGTGLRFAGCAQGRGRRTAEARGRSAWPAGGTMGPGTRALQASWARWRPSPPSRIGPVSPRVAESRSSRTLSRTSTCRTAIGRPPTVPSAVAPWEKCTEPPDWGGATSRGRPAAQSGAHSSLCHPPGRERGAPGPLPPTPRGPHTPRRARARPRRLTGSCSCCWGPHP